MNNPQRTQGPRPPRSRSRAARGFRVSRVTPRQVGREDGAAAVEFAIVATLFFMLVFGIIDFGFAFHSWNNAANAAREGARKAAVTRRDTAAIAARTIAAAPRSIPPSSRCRSRAVAGAARVHHVPRAAATWLEGDIVRVVVNYAVRHDHADRFLRSGSGPHAEAPLAVGVEVRGAMTPTPGEGSTIMRERLKDEHGAIAVLAALTIVILFAAVAFVIDISRLYHERQVLQNAVDFGSLAGAQDLPVQGARTGERRQRHRAHRRDRERAAGGDGRPHHHLPVRRRRSQQRRHPRSRGHPVRVRPDGDMVVGVDAQGAAGWSTTATRSPVTSATRSGSRPATRSPTTSRR